MTFFGDDELTKKRGARIHLAPPIPDTGWTLPESPPNLDNAVMISFDCETKDTTLNTEGPGWARGKAHVVGVSLGAVDRQGNRGAWYFPVRHEIEPHINLNPEQFFPWLNRVMDTPHIRKVGANITYDIGNLACEGVRVSGPLEDVQFGEALIDSEATVALEALGQKYLGEGKDSGLLRNWVQLAYPDTKPTHWRGDIYRSPARLAASYAISDAFLPLDIWEKQVPILNSEQLDYVYRLECDLIPLMIEMRLAGISVDVDMAYRMIDEIEADTRKLYERIYAEYGFNLMSSSNAQLAALFDHVGIRYNNTAAGNAEMRKEWLAGLDHPLGRLVNDIREHEKIVGTFLKGYVIDKSVNGKLYPQFHQLKGDENGTLVGRFSSSDPNLQNIPARTKLGKRVRECFVHDEGHHRWTKFDQSQIHYRLLAHFAVGPGSDELRQDYIDNPATDYHNRVYYNVCPFMGWDASDKEAMDFRRRPIKNVNFGLLYGQSEKALGFKTASYFGDGFTDDQVKAFFKAYFDGAPYVKPTMKAIGQEVQQFGYVTTILGRRIRFHLFEPAIRQKGEYYDPLPYHAALRAYGAPLRRAYEYRGVNYKFQGSEPDVMKQGMLDCYRSGVFNVTGVPRVTVHDEINFSIPHNDPIMRQALDYVAHLMTNCVKLRIPLKVDEEDGPSWGKVKSVV